VTSLQQGYADSIRNVVFVKSPIGLRPVPDRRLAIL